MAAIFLGLILLFAVPQVSWRSASAQTASEQTTAPVVIDRKKLLVQPRNPDGSIIETPFREDPVLWMRNKQQNFYRSMNTSLRQLKATSSVSAGWTLFFMSFLYGVFHAAGPGHGKAVISGWLLATENELKRGVLIAFMSAIIQALTAITIVSALLLFVGGASQMARSAADFLESASYAMVAGMGLYLVWTSSKGHSHSPVPATTIHNHGATHFELVSRPNADRPSPDHVHDENCGHAHAPNAAELRGVWSWKRAFALAFAVGIRPCSGAILVLVFSYPLGLYAAGVASVLAMGVGVFLTISLIAVLTVYAKNWAFRLGGADNAILGLVVKWGKAAVGFGLAALGTLMFLGSLGGITTNL